MSFFNTESKIEMKKKNEALINQLEDNIKSCNEIMMYINENCHYNYITSDFISFYNNLCVDLEKQLRLLRQMKKINDDKIYTHCEHNFITDIIDVDPEKDKTICYCTLCELTKRE